MKNTHTEGIPISTVDNMTSLMFAILDNMSSLMFAILARSTIFVLGKSLMGRAFSE